jgi:hypothetical protein
MLKSFYYLGFGLIAIFFSESCKVEYQPSIKNAAGSFIVVEGNINGEGITSVKLSRSRKVTWGDTAAYHYELNAHVDVEDNNNDIYPLYEKGKGVYEGFANVTEGHLYRLHFRTSDNEEYVSDFVRYKKTPPIDSLYWHSLYSGVNIFLDTHDPSNKTKFYRWDYLETFDYHSYQHSILIYDTVHKKVIPRTHQADTCWSTWYPGEILIDNTENLMQDVISKEHMLFIPYQDHRINMMFRLIVTQYALDSAGYQYWKAMRNNNQKIGSIFDPQPDLAKGNIHNISDTNELVLGYIGASSARKDTLYISNSEVTPGWMPPPLDTCELTMLVPSDSVLMEKYFHFGGFVPIRKQDSSAYSETYLAGFGSCVDCTLHGGTNVKPAFWP